MSQILATVGRQSASDVLFTPLSHVQHSEKRTSAGISPPNRKREVLFPVLDMFLTKRMATVPTVKYEQTMNIFSRSPHITDRGLP